MKKKCKNKYEMGGTLNGNSAQNVGSNIGNLAGTALSLAGIPGLAPILGGIGGQIGSQIDMGKVLQDHFNTFNKSTNPYGSYKMGGELGGGYDNLLLMGGKSHNQGGVQVDSSGLPSPNGTSEVEKGETALRLGTETFIFSKHLKV